METKEDTMMANPKPIAKDRTVTITVMVKDLYNLRPTEVNVDHYTSLSGDDGFGNEFGDSNHDFETEAFKNFNVIWNIEASAPNGVDADYDLSLDYVEHNPSPANPNFFTEDRLDVKSNGMIRGKISDDVTDNSRDDNYTIYFTIVPPVGVAGGPQTFPIDPKIRIIGGGA